MKLSTLLVGVCIVACSESRPTVHSSGVNATSVNAGGAAGEGGISGASGMSFVADESSSGGATASSAGGSGAANAATSGGSGGASGGTGGDGNSVTLATSDSSMTATSSTTGASNTSFTVNVQLASDVDPNAPTTVGIVTWSTSASPLDSARIEFGLDTNYGFSAPVDLSQAGYRTLLLGMKPAKTYHFRIRAEVGGSSVTSDDYTLQTGPPTNLVGITSFDVEQPTARRPGFIVSSYWQGEASSMAFILDQDGEIVWWYDTQMTGVARARMSADGKNMWLVTAHNRGAPLQRVSLDTLEAESYPQALASHDITAVQGSTMAYIDYGEADCDSVFEIDPSGTSVEVFESSELLGSSTAIMNCHGNALRYSATEDVYVYTDFSKDVFVIDRQSRNVAWRLSERLDGGIESLGGRQHGQHLLDASLLVFANMYNNEDRSVVLEFSHTGQELWRYEAGHFSANFGDVQRLPGGNTLVTYSNAAIIREVNQAGDSLLTITGSESRIGYALWRETLYGAPPDIVE